MKYRLPLYCLMPVVLAFTCHFLQAQENATRLIDSFHRQYLVQAGKEVKDTTRIRLLINYGNNIAWAAPDLARSVLLQALDSSRRLQYNRGTAISLMALGTLYNSRGSNDTCLLYNRQALDAALAIQPPNTSLVSKIYSNIAGVYHEFGAYKDALVAYYQAIDYAERSGSYKSQASAYSNLATVLESLGEYDKALEYIMRGQHLAQTRQQAAAVLPYLYLNESSILLKKGNSKEATRKAQQVLSLGKEFRPPVVTTEAWRTIGEIALQHNDTAAAIYHYRQAMQAAADYPLGEMQAGFSLAKAYLQLKDYQQAEQYFLKALQLATTLRHRRSVMEINASMASLYKVTHRYAEAYAAFEKSILQKDSIINIERIIYANTLEAQYQTALKDKEIAEKKLQIRQQQEKITRKNTWIISLVVAILVIIAAFFTFYYYRRRIQKQKEEITAWQALIQGEEKERTRIARELHDGIGGLLSTVKMYFATIREQNSALQHSTDYSDALKLLDNTLTEVRQTAHNLMPELLLRNGLAESIRVLCATISQRSHLKIDFHYYGFIDRLQSSFELSTYRIIQELIQNILKHAQAGTALVQLSQHDSLLSITVEDNGTGISTEDFESKGMGLKNVKQRTEGLHGNFHLKTEKGKGTSILLEFDLTKYQ